jgi:iron complex outermembrane receptor protein
VLPCLGLSLGVLLVGASSARAQDAAGQQMVQVDQNDSLRIRLPVLIVTPQKEEEPAQDAPVSVTAVPRETLDAAGVRSVSEASEYAPNAYFNEFTARKLSNARFRGVGSSPANPGVTTYIDGVPQLNTNSSSLELLDVDQIEFVRGPQSALFGRNALSGVINIVSSRPSLRSWTGSAVAPVGNFRAGDLRASASGPLVTDRLGLGIAMGYSRREGFTRNPLTGNDLDSRSALFGKTQLYWTPSANWDARFMLTVERARDGDYALNDLASVRAAPFEAPRDVEGHTHRDIAAPTVQFRRTGRTVDLWATTGLVWWETDDLTDLDYSALPLATRRNNERDRQFTQEVRVASARDRLLTLSDAVAMTWQAGAFVFTQAYEQEAINDYGAFVLSPLLAFPVREHTPVSRIDDRGIGVYGEATFTVRDRFDATIGLRGDVEHKEASLDSFFTPLIAPPVEVQAEADFGDVSPQFTAAYRASAATRVYATVSRGFKAGGFNPASPAGREAYGEEHSWNVEGGVKTMWFEERLSVNAAVFHLRWQDMQVNAPNLAVPGQFFIENAAGAISKGLEVEMNARLAPGCDVFASLGWADARFEEGSVSGGVAVDGRRLANAPKYTANAGGQYSVSLPRSATGYVRAELVFRGPYFYDDANTAEQEAHSLANFRAGVRGRRLFGEIWTRNAFDTQYVPLAFPFATPSGFVGEPGAPRTFGLRAGVTF